MKTETTKLAYLNNPDGYFCPALKVKRSTLRGTRQKILVVGLGRLEVGPAHRFREIGDWWWDCPRHCFRVISLVKSGLYTAILCASPYFRKLNPKVQEMERNGPIELHQTKPGFPSCDVFIKLLRCIGWGSSGSYGRLARWNHPCSWRTSWTSCRNQH